MTPLLVSFIGNRGGQHSQGMVVVDNRAALAAGADIVALCRRIERTRGYDEGTLVLISFQRLEALPANQQAIAR